MPGSGSLIIRPIEAHFLDNDEKFDRMSSYCDLQLGAKHAKTEICKHGGANPFWKHPLVVPVKDEHAQCKLEVMGEEPVSEEKDVAGSCDIDLEEVKNVGNLRKWYTLTKNGQNEGDILVEASFLPELPTFFGTRSAPCQEKSSEKTEIVKVEGSRENAERKPVRKFSDNRQDRMGRGWNLYVPGEDLNDPFADLEDLSASKSKSVVLDESEVEIGKIERRKSFWEKLLNM